MRRSRAPQSIAAASGALLLSFALAAAQPAVQRDWIDAGAGNLHYELRGSAAQTVVLLHEMGMTLDSWDEVVPALAQTHRVLRYDLRGFGLSEKIRGSVGIEDELADLQGLLDGLGIREPVTLIGGAIGGTIALKFAARHPERVRALVVVSPVAGPPRPAGAASPPPPAPSATPRVDNSPAGIIERESVRAYLATQTESVYPARLHTPARLARFRGMQLSSDPVSRVLTTRALGTVSIAEDIPRIACPTLIVSTTLFNNGGMAKPLADAIPGAQFVALETGHFAALESPELLLPVLTRFLQSPAR